MQMAVSYYRGRWNVRCGQPARRSRASLRASASRSAALPRQRLLIASGADAKTVQGRLRHASAKTTLDTCGHVWPDRDESTRAAIEAVITARRNRDGIVMRRSGDGAGQDPFMRQQS